MKTEQLDLFPEPASPPKYKNGVCMKCGRKITSGKIGAGCLKKLKKDIHILIKLLQEALEK